MPRKPNYGFDKRRKEQDRKAKKDAKKMDRLKRRELESGPDGVTLPVEDAETNAPLSPRDDQS